jgi:CRISPR-associated protein Cmx8
MQKRYVYDVMQPRGAFLMALYPDGDGAWIKLWRQMLWETLRGIPKTRLVYQERLEKKKCSLGTKIWQSLQDADELRKKGMIKTEGLSSSIYVGGQDTNAEQVPFRGQVEHNLLLHFWTLVSLVFAPQVHSFDGTTSQAGYVLVIPEPSDLISFEEDISDLLRSLETETAGYRPKASLIEVPEEGGLEYLYHLARRRVARKEISYSLAAVELIIFRNEGTVFEHLLLPE